MTNLTLFKTILSKYAQMDHHSIEEAITEKRNFKGFNSRFTSSYYDLYAAFRVAFLKPEAWVVFGDGYKSKGSGHFYLFDADKNLVAEKKLDSDRFRYRQKPTKQDGRNELRKARFESMNGSLVFELKYPTTASEMPFFLKELQRLALMKISSDVLENDEFNQTLLRQVKDDLGIIELEESQFIEGEKIQRLVNVYERNPKLRHQAIKIHGLTCNACGFDFEKVYGDLGVDFIEVHHLVPISKYQSEHEVDPVSELTTVCSNCHRMFHRSKTPISLEELRAILSGAD